MKATRTRHGWVHLFITHRPTLTLQLHNFDLFKTSRTSSFCTVAWQLARFQLTRRIARILGDSWASCIICWQNTTNWTSSWCNLINGCITDTVPILSTGKNMSLTSRGGSGLRPSTKFCGPHKGRQHQMPQRQTLLLLTKRVGDTDRQRWVPSSIAFSSRHDQRYVDIRGLRINKYLFTLRLLTTFQHFQRRISSRHWQIKLVRTKIIK